MNELKHIKTLPQLYKYSAERFKDHKSFFGRKDNQLEGISLSDLYKQGLYLGTALIDLGIEPQENVGLLADNRREWIMTHYALCFIAARDVPRGTDITTREMNELLPHAQVKVVIVEHEVMLKSLESQKDAMRGIKKIIIMDKNYKPTQKNHFSFYDLLEKGKQLYEEGDRRVEKRIETLREDDLVTIIYTSGSTGNPKGVMLMHSNLISQIHSILEVFSFNETDRLLTLLPVWHIFERVLEIACISFGASLYYTNVRQLKNDMQEVRPTIFPVAPRLLEKLHTGIQTSVSKSSLIKKTLFHAACASANQFNKADVFLKRKELRLKKRNIFFTLTLFIYNLIRWIVFIAPMSLLDTIVLAKIRKVTGGEIKSCISGSSALPQYIDHFFYNIGIPIYEGYGLTETSPVLAVRRPGNVIKGCVGQLWPDTDLRLIDINTNEVIYDHSWSYAKRIQAVNKKGEIHVRGPQVMKGYYRNEKQTKRALKDAWFNTGDLGVMSYNETLKIVGRSKDTIVLLGGENVEPTPVEDALLSSPYIEKCVLVGQDKKYLSCLIVPNAEMLSNFGDTYETIINNPQIGEIIQGEIKKQVNTSPDFKSFEKIVNFRILPKEFEIGDELNYVFKIKRNVVLEKYAALIEGIYN